MKRILFVLLLGTISLARAEEQPPYEVKDPAISENFRQIYYSVDELSALTEPLSYEDEDSFCVDDPTFCVDPTADTVTVGEESGSEQFLVPDGTDTMPSLANIGDTNTGFGWPGANGNIIQVMTAGVVVSSFTASGEVLQPRQPSFLVQADAATDVTGDGTEFMVSWGTEIRDVGSDFATSTHTVPVGGLWQYNIVLRTNGWAAAHTTFRLHLVTSNRTYKMDFTKGSAVFSLFPACLSVLADMDANDTAAVTITGEGSTKVVDVDASNNIGTWGGSLIN